MKKGRRLHDSAPSSLFWNPSNLFCTQARLLGNQHHCGVHRETRCSGLYACARNERRRQRFAGTERTWRRIWHRDARPRDAIYDGADRGSDFLHTKSAVFPAQETFRESWLWDCFMERRFLRSITSLRRRSCPWVRSLYLHTPILFKPPMGWSQLVIHLFCVGLPIALVMRQYSSLHRR